MVGGGCGRCLRSAVASGVGVGIPGADRAGLAQEESVRRTQESVDSLAGGDQKPCNSEDAIWKKSDNKTRLEKVWEFRFRQVPRSLSSAFL
jgi:hypothetical protein